MVAQQGVSVELYGLLNDFRGRMFDSSRRAMELATRRVEYDAVCGEDKKSRANIDLRFVKGMLVTEGEQVEVENDEVTYRSLCFGCAVIAATKADVELPFPTTAMRNKESILMSN